jgi:hypothetical protein
MLNIYKEKYHAYFGIFLMIITKERYVKTTTKLMPFNLSLTSVFCVLVSMVDDMFVIVFWYA